jgi:sulfite exporter TauE/SafE
MAAATGGILTGAVGMLLFILGTAPLLVAFGFGAREIGAVFRDRAVKISGIILVVMGVWTLYRTWPSAPPCCHHAARQEVISNQ